MIAADRGYVVPCIAEPVPIDAILRLIVYQAVLAGFFFLLHFDNILGRWTCSTAASSLTSVVATCWGTGFPIAEVLLFRVLLHETLTICFWRRGNFGKNH